MQCAPHGSGGWVPRAHPALPGDSFARVFDCVAPIARSQLGQQFRMPRTWPPRDRNGYFDIGSPQGKAFLANAARRKYQKWPTRLAVGSRLMAQTGSRNGRIKADAGQYLPGLRSYRCRTRIARWKSRKCLLHSGIYERLIEGHGRPSV